MKRQIYSMAVKFGNFYGRNSKNDNFYSNLLKAANPMKWRTLGSSTSEESKEDVNIGLKERCSQDNRDDSDHKFWILKFKFAFWS